MKKRQNGPCTCGQRHADPSATCAPECLSLYPRQPVPGDEKPAAPKRLNARQFFDVWIGAVQGVRCAVGPKAFPVPVCRSAVESVISWVHGDSVGRRAAAYFDALLLECRERRGL